jgi:hypothetical protein
MIAPGDTVRTMTGRIGVVEAVDVPTHQGCGRTVLVRIGPLVMQFHACDDVGIVPSIAALYHPNDLTIIAEEAPRCSSPS